MTTDLCGEDVIVRLTTPQIITTETVIPGNASVSTSQAQPGARAAAAGMEFGRRLLLAARAGDYNTVLELMAKGAPFTTDWLGTSPLHLSAANNHVETCAVLLRAGVSCDSRTKVERTPLHLAAHAGHAQVVSLLLEHGAMVDCRDMLHMTPLHWAAARGHLAVARELLNHGADIRARCKFRKTPRCLAARHQRLDVLALLEAAALQEQMSETPKPLPEFDPLGDTPDMQILKPPTKEKIQPEKTIVIESKTEPVPISLSSGATAGTSAGTSRARRADAGADADSGAALLRAHGITLLPADRGCTVLTALKSGRTVVLSDAGKFMLKESCNSRLSEAPILVDNINVTNADLVSDNTNTATSTPITVNSANINSTNFNTAFNINSASVSNNMISGVNSSNSNSSVVASGNGNIVVNNRNVVVRARAVRSVRSAKNVKVVTLNKPDQTLKKIIHPGDLQQVKLVQVSSTDSKMSPSRPRPALKLLLNKANLTRLLASTKSTSTLTSTPTPTPTLQHTPLTLSTLQATQEISTDLMDTLESTQDITMEEGDNIVRIPEQFFKSSSTKYLRSQLLAAHAAIANLTAELRLCKAKLAKYEKDELS